MLHPDFGAWSLALEQPGSKQTGSLGELTSERRRQKTGHMNKMVSSSGKAWGEEGGGGFCT